MNTISLSFSVEELQKPAVKQAYEALLAALTPIERIWGAKTPLDVVLNNMVQAGYLTKEGFETLADIAGQPISRLSKIPMIGPKAILRIRDALKDQCLPDLVA